MFLDDLQWSTDILHLIDQGLNTLAVLARFIFFALQNDLRKTKGVGDTHKAKVVEVFIRHIL